MISPAKRTPTLACNLLAAFPICQRLIKYSKISYNILEYMKYYYLLLEQVDPGEAYEDVAQAGGVRVLLLMKVSGELEVRVHVPRGGGKTKDERKEEVARIKTLPCFFQPGFYPNPRSNFCSINLCAGTLNCGHICLL